MPASEFNVSYIARLARLQLTPEEQAKIGSQLSQIVDYIDKLKQVDITGIEPTAHAVPLVNVFRSDEMQPSLPIQDVLLNAPARANDLIIVPKIVD